MNCFFMIFYFFTTSASPGQIDPRVNLYLENSSLRHLIYNPFHFTSDLKNQTLAPVTIRISSLDFERKLLDSTDQDFIIKINRNKKPARIGRVFLGYLNAKGLEKIRKMSFVERIELDRPSGSLRPLHITRNLIGADVVNDLIFEMNRVTGHGVKVADIDSGLDIYQPTFFRADGGYYSWIDGNSNGSFDPGSDCVDLNNDGICQDSEVLHLVDALFNSYFGQIDTIGGVSMGRGSFQTGQDYLFADTNGNGRRDNDSELGSNSDSPGLGEPFFIADDVNKNGVLDPDEKVIMLSTSKVKSIYQNNRTRRRGQDLRETEVDSYAMHGTGVCSILAGGQAGLNRYTGIAPDADIIFIQDTVLGLFEAFEMATSEGANVVLHEYAPWTGYFLDGSSNQELAMDESAAQGVVNVNPAGNLGGSSKGWAVNLNSGTSHEASLTLPGGTSAAPYIQMTLLWRTNEELTATLTMPGGTVLDLNTPTAWQSAGPSIYYAVINDTSSRGTKMIDVIIAAWNDQTGNYENLTGGDFTLNITSGGMVAESTYIAGFVMDSDSGWGEGFKWNSDVTEAHLIGFSGTADTAIALAAYTGRDETELEYYGNSQGELYDYSGRGHRIDGEKIMHIAAPANPLSSMAGPYVSEGNYYNQFMVFGGTSGAGPHVAGAAVLLKQLYPDDTGIQIRDRIRSGALVDSDVLTPGNLPQDELWGAGKLRIYQSAWDEDPPANTPPLITADNIEGFSNSDVSLVVAVSDGETATENLQVRWDFNYDGEWDTDFSLDHSTTYRWILPGNYLVKAQVMDEMGSVSSILVSVSVSVYVAPPDEKDDEGCSCAVAGTGKTSTGVFFILTGMVIAMMRRRRQIKK